MGPVWSIGGVWLSHHGYLQGPAFTSLHKWHSSSSLSTFQPSASLFQLMIAILNVSLFLSFFFFGLLVFPLFSADHDRICSFLCAVPSLPTSAEDLESNFCLSLTAIREKMEMDPSGHCRRHLCPRSFCPVSTTPYFFLKQLI